MSKYTTEVRFICEHASGMNESIGYSSVDAVISGAIPKVFDFTFPIFDESYRNVLCGKILKHYYTREICEETVGLWKLRLSTRLNEIMPYYNQLYKSEALEFNPLFDVDYTRDSEQKHNGTDNVTKSNSRNISEDTDNTNTKNGAQTRTISGSIAGTEKTTNVGEKTTDSDGGYSETGKRIISGTNNNESNTTTSADTTVTKTERDMYSDTPQGALTNLETGEYLTNARKKTGEENNETDGSSNGTSNTTYNETNDDTKSGTNNFLETVNDNFESNRTNNSTESKTDKNTENSTDKFTGNRTTVDTENGSNNRTIQSTEDYLEHISGKMGSVSYSKMLMEFRETFLNIDMMVINALADLFFNLW